MLTGDQYRKSLDDGRVVYSQGKRVDVTSHPIFARSIDRAAEVYDQFYQPGEDATNDYFRAPNSVEEMRHHLSIEVDVLAHNSYGALMTLLTSADRIEDIRPQGSQAIRQFVKDVQRKDFRIVECITDAKGDRSRPPSKQEDPDAYLRVVERREDGVVVRGAKLHISGAAIGHELLVIPTKAMKPGEEDYAIAFSVPVNTPGVKIINVTSEERSGEGLLDSTLTANNHTPMGFVVFDDVFVPNERIFLDGEVRAAATFAHALGLWVRLGGLRVMADEADEMVGFAQLIAEANGLERAPNIKDQITDIVMYATLVRATDEASLANCVRTEGGILVPDELFANAGKYLGASERALMLQKIQDIAGGSLTTAPSSRDLNSTEVGALVHKYMAAKPGISGEYRTRLFHVLRDLTSSAHSGHRAVETLQSGGGLFAQRIVTRGRYDMDHARRVALEMANLEDPLTSPITS